MVLFPDDKRYFRIGEASSIIGVESSVLRYWEKEFSELKPQRADSRQRTYQKKDLETLLQIKHLLYEEKMTIKGARQRLMQINAKKKTDSCDRYHSILKNIKTELKELLKELS